MSVKAARGPWSYVPLMYFLQAIPVSLVQDVAAIVYKDLGVGNESITRWTSVVALPWSLQMLLGPLVDLTATRRAWVVRTQAAIAAVLVGLPFLLRLPNPFALSLGALLVVAVFSALCNTAQDGFYLLAMPREAQAGFAGVQTTFYRLGTLFAKGLLVFVAGVAAKRFAAPTAWTLSLLGGALVYGGLYLLERRAIPRPPEDAPASTEPAEARRNVARTLSVVGLGIAGYFVLNAGVRLGANAVAVLADGPLKGWRLPERGAILGVAVPGRGTVAECLQILVCLPLAFAFFRAARRSIRGSAMGEAFGSFFRQSGVAAVLAFLMLYRFGEAMIMKMSPLFLKDAPAVGGLGLDNEQVGTIKGVVGVFGIVLGGLLGGLLVSRKGLRRSLLPLALCMHAPGLLYLWASIARPGVGPMFGVDFVEQFGYGFGFAGYTVVLQRLAQRGGFRTAHYALGVGVGALFIQVAGVLSGVLQANLGYVGFFAAAILFAVPGLATLPFLPLEEAHGG